VTCIVAGAGWMAADRRVSTDDGTQSSLIKIAKNRWLIAAAAGNATATLDVRRAVQKGAETPDDLVKHVDKESYALVLLPSGVVHIIGEGRVWPPKKGLHGIGSGSDLALGWLSRARDDLAACELWDTRALVRDAFRFVASRRTDCGGGCDFRVFG
jgi:ATP-dependent protease HslVU (ClpYQ) peptidase subunit